MKRVLALVGAALLIGLAVVVRGVLVDDDGDTDVSTGDDGETTDDLVVACITELEEVCRELNVAEIRVQDPADTIAQADEIDAWVTLDPWPEIAEYDDVPATLTQPMTALAQSPLSLLLRVAALEGCADWACAGGSGRAALATETSAFGLVSLGHAASEWSAVARPGEPFAAQELSLPEFQAWLGGIALGGDPVEDMLVLGNAGPHASAVTAAVYAGDVQPSPRASGLEAVPGAVPGSVVAVVTGPAAEQLQPTLTRALESAGWEPAEADARSTGVPDAGVLVALAQEVS